MVHISYFLIVVIIVSVSLCTLGIGIFIKMCSLLEENKQWYEKALKDRQEKINDSIRKYNGLTKRFNDLETERAMERENFSNTCHEYACIVEELKEKLNIAESRLSERLGSSPQYTQITFAQKNKNIERVEIGMRLPREEVFELSDEEKIEMAKLFAEKEAWRILEPRAMMQLDFDSINSCDVVRFSWFINSDGEILGRDSFFDFSRNKG